MSVVAPPPRTGPFTFGRHSPNLVHLDAGSVEAVARRVVELLAGTEAEGLIDAVEVARRRGCRRAGFTATKTSLG